MKRALYFYSLMAGLLLSSNGAFSQTWEERIVNGDFEGSDYSSFAINVKNEGTRDLDANDIVVDDDDANNHCARISFTANPWVTEFIIKMAEPLSEGDMIQFSMRAKTSSSKDASLASSLASEEQGRLTVKGGGEWNTCTYSGTIGAEQNGCQTITLRFNRTSSKSDIFHFDDVVSHIFKKIDDRVDNFDFVLALVELQALGKTAYISDSLSKIHIILLKLCPDTRLYGYRSGSFRLPR